MIDQEVRVVVLQINVSANNEQKATTCGVGECLFVAIIFDDSKTLFGIFFPLNRNRGKDCFSAP